LVCSVAVLLLRPLTAQADDRGKVSFAGPADHNLVHVSMTSFM
jgi:hypothetical protein